MSSFSRSLNEKNQFIIAVRINACRPQQEYQDGAAQLLVRESMGLHLPWQQHQYGTAQQLIMEAPIRRALIDTGAAKSVIRQELAEELQLARIGKTIMGTAGNPCESYRYKVDIAIPVVKSFIEKQVKTDDDKEVIERVPTSEEFWVHMQHNATSIPNVSQDRGFDFILGMDILAKMHITMFDRQIIMSF